MAFHRFGPSPSQVFLNESLSLLIKLAGLSLVMVNLLDTPSQEGDGLADVVERVVVQTQETTLRRLQVTSLLVVEHGEETFKLSTTTGGYGFGSGLVLSLLAAKVSLS